MDHYLTVLTQAAIASRTQKPLPTVDRIVEALLQAEKATKQQRLTYPLAGLVGQWRLCFTTGTRKVQRGGIVLGKGFYLPRFIPAVIEFQALPPLNTPLTITNQIQVLGWTLKFIGPARYMLNQHLLAFDFTNIQVKLGNLTLYAGAVRGGTTKLATFEKTPIAKLPFFSFFLVADDFIAARGRGGGLALWVREQTL